MLGLAEPGVAVSEQAPAGPVCRADEYDAVVIGARCAGAATALLLAEAGHRVLLADRSRDPAEPMSTRYIHQPGVARLRDWGVLPALLAAGCRRLTGLSHTVGGVTVGGPLPAYDGVDFAVAPARVLLDRLLVEAARESGAEYLPGVSLTGLTWCDGRVAGVRLRGQDGAAAQPKARVVIGADGMRSTVARLCDAAQTADDGRRTCVYYTGWRLADADFGDGFGATDHVRLVETSDAYLGVIPTDDGISLIATYAPQSAFARLRTDPAAAHLDMIRALTPGLYEALRGRSPALRLTGSGDQRNFLRAPTGPGWALVGDAGQHKDSITARGITDAFLQAELLAQVLAGRCGAQRTVDLALAEFARRRDGLLAESYAATLRAAQLQVTGRRVAEHARIRDSAALTAVYLGVLAGQRSAEELV
jgi:flavin-dependent dehydrogenase